MNPQSTMKSDTRPMKGYEQHQEHGEMPGFYRSRNGWFRKHWLERENISGGAGQRKKHESAVTQPATAQKTEMAVRK